MPSAEEDSQADGLAFRCTICNYTYPHRPRFAKCEACSTYCTPFSNMAAMSMEEANSIRNHALFEQYYEKREAKSLAERGALA